VDLFKTTNLQTKQLPHIKANYRFGRNLHGTGPGFSKPDRDPEARVISLAYYALIRIDLYDEEILKKKALSGTPSTTYPPCFSTTKTWLTKP
jgi:hypothetical protein